MKKGSEKQYRKNKEKQEGRHAGRKEGQLERKEENKGKRKEDEVMYLMYLSMIYSSIISCQSRYATDPQ